MHDYLPDETIGQVKILSMVKASMEYSKNDTPNIRFYYSKLIIAALLYPLAFAPFAVPGMTLISLALFYTLIYDQTKRITIQSGLIYGFMMFAFGVSWVIISIHNYGHISYLPALLITLLFLSYLALFPMIAALSFKLLHRQNYRLFSCFIFAATWVLSECLRATVMTGFPWLLVGTSQVNAPMKFLAPVIGTYGISFFCCLAATFLANSVRHNRYKRSAYLIAAVLIICGPQALKNTQWTQVKTQALSTAVIQLNLTMRDKWNDRLFWDIIDKYTIALKQNYANDLLVMPETSIPTPDIYVQEILKSWDNDAQLHHSALLLGILKSIHLSKQRFHNSMLALGQAEGYYDKRHLVPFGEYFPAVFQKFKRWLDLPEGDLDSGSMQQRMITVKNIPIATLICYEIAYPNLLRQVLHHAEFIVSISDNGWFGQSIAGFQQLEMARMLSLQTGRYTVLANNDGLSSVIDTKGYIVGSLPAFESGVLRTKIYPASGATPWVFFGDAPVVLLMLFIILLAVILKIKASAKDHRCYSIDCAHKALNVDI